MAQEGRHVFTQEEGGLGVKNSRLTRRAELKLEKTLAKLHLEEATIAKLIDIVKVGLASPPGIFLFGELLIDGLDKIGYFASSTPAPSTPGATSPPASPAQQKAGAASNAVLTFISKALPPGLGDVFAWGATLGGNAVNPTTGTVSGPLGAGIQNVTSANLSAAFLRDGLLAICMVQALGGGSGIANIATSVLAGVVK